MKIKGRKPSSYNAPVEISKLNKQELEKVVSSWAKRANTRLRELEKQGMEEASNVYIYLRGMEAVGVGYMDKTKQGGIKFKTKVKKQTANQLKQEASKLKTFLFDSKTSTPVGARQRLEKPYQAYLEVVNSRQGVPMSFKEFTRNFTMNGFRKAAEMWGSEQAFEVYSGTYGMLEDSQMDELVNEFYERYMSSQEDPSFKSFEKSIVNRLKINEEELSKAREDTRDLRDEIDKNFMDALNKL